MATNPDPAMTGLDRLEHLARCPEGFGHADIPVLLAAAAEIRRLRADARRLDLIERRRLDLMVDGDGRTWAVTDPAGAIYAAGCPAARAALDAAAEVLGEEV